MGRVSNRRKTREGNVALIVALTLPMMMAFIALSVDMGSVYRVRTAGQAAVDSAALAGAGALNGRASGVLAAHDRAVTYGDLHYSYGQYVQLQDSDINFGSWNAQTKTFTPTNDPAQTNAVRVQYQVPAVATPFASILGQPSQVVSNHAIALGGGPISNQCPFPIVVEDCALAGAVLNQNCDLCLRMADANTDNAGWTSFQGPIGEAQIAAKVQAACFNGSQAAVDPNTHECNGPGAGCTASSTSQLVNVNGGNLLSTSQNGFCEMIYELLMRNGTPEYFTVSAPVLKTGAAPGPACGSFGINGTVPIAGYVKLDIFGVSCGSGAGAQQALATPPFASGQSDCNNVPPSSKYVMASVHRKNGVCDDTPENAPSGGAFFGTLARPRLVE